ncbi:MAG TPA: NAD(P)(+) transhydrogenase, partial [Psychrobacter sp.]|nr:NAD(P)(+) transhydrogenase [Psychrobacter sp.]
PEHTEGKNKKEKIEQTHEQVTEDIMHHPDLVNPLDDTRIDVKSGFTKDSQRLKSDKHEFEYDAVVLGAGPAGEAAAMKLAKSGKKVVVIDPREQVGGNCTHVGTIPSKALRQSVFNLINFRRDQMFTKTMNYHQVPLNIVLAKARNVIRQQVNTHTRFYERNQIEVIHGWANFVDKNTIRIEIDENTFETITFNKAIITVGSRPYRPDILDFNHPRVFDSDKILQMDYVVKKIIIYG